ncbi:MAG TPA: hypothetical protein VGF86_09070 [Candidatus Tumulicola sp.]|jgi:hypothetical protein
MSVTHLPPWESTAIEIALDLERIQLANPSGSEFSGPAEPRICVVACFALSSQLKRIVTAVDRVVPSRLPDLRIARAATRVAVSQGSKAVAARAETVAITPMLPLLRLQLRLIRAILPGLADRGAEFAAHESDPDASNARFIAGFIAMRSLPAFEPSAVGAEFSPVNLGVTGLTIYRLGKRGVPQSILGHWSYVRNARSSVHLRSGL